MKKLFSSITLVALIGMIVAIGAGATDITGAVHATVTADVIAVTTDTGTVTYGTLVPGGTANTVALTQTQTITNTGNVAENFEIKGMDSADWTLESAAGTDEYYHGYCKDNTSDSCAVVGGYTAMDTEYSNGFVSNKAALGTTALDLWIQVPTVNTATDVQHVDVTILATKYIAP